MKTLTVNYELSQNDLQCCICLQDLTFPLIQCSTGNHFVCDICRKKTTRNCPVCRTSKLYHNEFLERHLQNQVTECKNKLCKLKMFEWTVDTLKYVSFNRVYAFSVIMKLKCKTLTII